MRYEVGAAVRTAQDCIYRIFAINNADNGYFVFNCKSSSAQLQFITEQLLLERERMWTERSLGQISTSNTNFSLSQDQYERLQRANERQSVNFERPNMFYSNNLTGEGPF